MASINNSALPLEIIRKFFDRYDTYRILVLNFENSERSKFMVGKNSSLGYFIDGLTFLTVLD